MKKTFEMYVGLDNDAVEGVYPFCRRVWQLPEDGVQDYTEWQQDQDRQRYGDSHEGDKDYEARVCREYTIYLC